MVAACYTCKLRGSEAVASRRAVSLCAVIWIKMLAWHSNRGQLLQRLYHPGVILLHVVLVVWHKHNVLAGQLQILVDLHDSAASSDNPCRSGPRPFPMLGCKSNDAAALGETVEVKRIQTQIWISISKALKPLY